MIVTFRVLNGAHAGKEFPVPAPQCLIGRAADCYLRVKSDAISRHHCVAYVQDGSLRVRDLHSRNGTFVNGTRITEKDCELKSGDELRIGGMAFEVHILHRLHGPNTSSKGVATQKPSESRDSSIEESDIAQWLTETRPITSATDESAILPHRDTPSLEQTKPEATQSEQSAVFKGKTKANKIPGSWSQKPTAASTEVAAEEALKNILLGG